MKGRVSDMAYQQSRQGGNRRTTELLLLIAAAIPVGLIYAMYIANTGTAVSFSSMGVPIGIFAAFALAHIAVRKLAPGADPVILPIVFLLSGIGITFVQRLAPDSAGSQVMWLFLSVIAMIVVLFFVKSIDELAQYKFSAGIAGVVLLLLPMVIGTEHYGSKLWIEFGSFSFQPGELAKILIVIFLACYLAENREMLSATTRKIGPLAIPRPRMLAPAFIMLGLCLLVVIFERDLGSALLFYVIFVVMLYAATGRLSFVVIALLLLAIGGTFCYQLFDHVQTRVAIWLDPWSDAQGTGYQIVQSLYSLADGGMVGAGIGRGLADYVPIVESDFIFSAIGEEMGLLGASAILIAYMLFAVRGFATAARAKSDVAAFMAVGLTASISFQAFLIVGGVTKLLPMTGVTLPFMSQGGSSLLSSFIAVALLLKCGDEATGREQEMTSLTSSQAQPVVVESGSHAAAVVQGSHARGRFKMQTPESGVLGRVALGKRLTALISVFTILFAFLIGNLTYIQVVQAEEIQSMPTNNHTITKSAYVQRGAIMTSDGVTLAESLQQADGTYVRSYPQGSLAVHMVGYLSTQYGSSGIENTMNETLTGKKDYSTWQSALYSLAGVSQPGSSVVLTINSQMQAICEDALDGWSGAIVILEPSTGKVLACASNPTYTNDQIGDLLSSSGSALVNRATLSLYAPGSTFKVLTLAAALDTNAYSLDDMISCQSSMDIGGAAVTNYNNNDYGTLSLAKALAYSSNVAFGQVGAKIGANTLVSYANAFGYDTSIGQDFYTATSLMPNPSEMTEWETAWSACGQPVGEHESPAGPQTTVMENAIVAATIANGGVAMNPYIVDHVLSPEGVTTTTTQPRSLGQPISSTTASEVGDAMLGVVEDGITASGARISGVKVAGKTGTAQTSKTDANSLFIGYAPYDSPTLAISICLENDETNGSEPAARVAGSVIRKCLAVQAQGAAS